MDRRQFLKYSGATAAVVGASALGLDYLLYDRTNQVSPSYSNETLSSSISKSIESSSTQEYSLEGRLIFDYNGNGVQDEGEPGVQNATVQVQDLNGQVITEALTDSSGDYTVDLPAGNYNLYIQPESRPGNPDFTHMCSSPSELRPIATGYNLGIVRGGNIWTIGLVEGPFTQPFRSSTEYSVACYVNWDGTSKERRTDSYLWWNGESGSFSDLILYNNGGIDMPMAVGQDVLAPAPGVMNAIFHGSRGQLGLTIAHPDLGLGWFGTAFNHLSEILLPMGTRFARGDVIAKSGTTGTPIPHLHFNNWLDFSVECDNHCANGSGIFDFYQPEFEITSKTSGYWFPDEFTWHSVPLGTSPNGKNLWTRLNKPVFFQ